MLSAIETSDFSLEAFESLVRADPARFQPPGSPEYEGWLRQKHAEWRSWQLRLAKQELAPRFQEQWGDELTLPEQEWLIRGVLARRSYCLWYGQRGSGKSFALIDLAYRGALGLPFLGHEVPEAFGSVLFVGEKQPGFSKRVLAWLEAHGRRAERLPVRIIPQVPDLTNGAAVSELIRYLGRVVRPEFEDMGVPLGLVAFDTLMKCLPGGSVVDNGTASTALANLQRIVEQAGTAVLPLAHLAKGATGEDASAKGAGEWEDAAETVFRIQRVKNSTVRALINTKQSDAAEAPPAYFELEEVIVGADQSGATITSCVVKPVAKPEKSQPERSTRRRPLTADGALVIQQLAALTREKRREDENGHLSILLKELRERTLACGFRASTRPAPEDRLATKSWHDATRKAFDRIIASLCRAGRIETDGVSVRLVSEGD